MRKLLLSILAVVCVIFAGEAQNKMIHGTVTDASGNPIVGAAVVVTGTGTGVTTNSDGRFAVSAPANGTLDVSFLGYVTQRAAINNQTNLKITLQEDTHAIDDVIVVAYGQTTKEAFTGSAAVVKGDAIEKRQVSDVTKALNGQVAGVQGFSANGQPGTSASIRIRGIGSMNASSAPLYIVDGAPYDSDISSLNPSDIESMTVLKDAAASAIYGARGANGVIIITTKRSKSQEAVVTLDAKWGANSRALPNYDVMSDPNMYYETAYAALFNSQYYRGASAVSARATALASLIDRNEGGTGMQIYTLPEGEALIGSNGKINPRAKLGYSDGEYYYIPDNWENELFGKSTLRQEYNATISGSTDKMNYYGSFGFLDDGGLIKGSSFTRYTARIKADYQAKKWLKVGANVGYTYSDMEYVGGNGWTSSNSAFYYANYIAPIYPMYVRNADGSIKVDERGLTVYDYGSSTNQIRSFLNGNPKGNLELDGNHNLSDVITGQFYATAQLYKGLEVTANISTNVTNLRYNEYKNPFYGPYVSLGGVVAAEHDRYFGVNQQYMATYNNTFADVHHIDLLAGFERYVLTMQSISAQSQMMYHPFVGELSNTIYDKPDVSSGTTQYITQGFLARAQYDYDGRIFVSGSYRRDASSRFHPDHRWGNFGSVGAAWLISHEKWMDGASNWLDMLKIKASYGIQGNDNLGTGPYYKAYLDQYTLSNSNGDFATTFAYKGNPELTWEASHNFNVGVDFSFWKGRLAGTVEYFYRKTSDMLYNRPVSSTLGYSSVPENVGAMANSGVEIDLTARFIETRNFTWDFNFNLTHYSNKILDLADNLRENGSRGAMRILRIGGSIYDSYLQEWAGVDPETGLDSYYVDNADGTVTTTTDYNLATQRDLGTTLPKVYGGFGTTFNFYGVDLSISCAYQLGGKLYDFTYQELMHAGDAMGTNWHMDILRAWTPENRYTDVQRLDAGIDTNQKLSSKYLISSNYLSLDNITLGYTLPRKWTSKIGLSKLRVYFSADNVALCAKRKGVEPRSSAAYGVTYADYGSFDYSAIRSLSGGIQITF